MCLTLLRIGVLVSAVCLTTLSGQCNGGPPRAGIAPLPPEYRGPGDIAPAPEPGTPATPAPGVPNAPATREAHTPTHRGGAVQAGAPPSTKRGAPITFTHRRNAIERLRVDWVYPNLAPVRPEGDTAATPRSRALPAPEMLGVLAGDDPRPLLILRECHRCQGSEAALLDREQPNEKTILLARWFRCIRLGDSVRHETHPCHLLFAEHGMPHLLLWSPQAKSVEMLDGSQPQSRLWSAMRKVLRQSYRKDPDAAVSAMFTILAAFDHLDSMEAETSARLQAALDEVDQSSPRVQALEAELVKLRAERDALVAREREVLDLGLRPPADGTTR